MEARALSTKPGPVTADELLAMGDDAWRYELVGGRLVRMSPTGFGHSYVALSLVFQLKRFVSERGLGQVTIPETGFLVSPEGSPDTVLAPDVAFIRAERVPKPESPEWERFPRLAPDLVAEVASPSQRRAEMRVKAKDWLEAGVPLVWLVLPQARVVEVWRPEGLIRTVGAEEELEGENVLPGFRLPVVGLFA